MSAQPANPNDMSDAKNKLLNVFETQLRSQTPSAIWKGIQQIRQWLINNLEDQDVYALLLDAVEKNSDLREEVRTLLSDMIEAGSISAKSALQNLPSSIQELLADADDTYRKDKYDDALALYRKIIRLDPKNIQAQTGLNKVEMARNSGETNTNLPKEAIQYYRRARSYIAARDYKRAVDLLNAAIESAQDQEMDYRDAEIALSNMQNLLTAEEYKENARLALKKKKWSDGIDYYSKALTLDPTNETVKKELSNLERRIKRAPIIRIGVVIGVIILIFTLAIMYIKFKKGIIEIDIDNPTFTQATNTITVTPTSTDKPTMMALPLTSTNTPTKVATSTVTITPEMIILGYGKLTGYVYPLETPNGRRIGSQLGPKQSVTVLGITIDHGEIWYKCQWSSQGISGVGWILGSDIRLGPQPSLTPAP